MFFRCQQVRHLESRLRLAERDLERLQEKAGELEKRCAFYRRQCTLEARYGLLVQRVFGDLPPGMTVNRERSGILNTKKS